MVDFADGNDLLAGAGVVVLDDHVDGEVGGVPVLIYDDDLLAGSALVCLDGAGFADAAQGDAVVAGTKVIGKSLRC
jgi:hypothetical protein